MRQSLVAEVETTKGVIAMSILERARRGAGGSTKRYLARHRTAVPLKKSPVDL
jgi:hypothetical protein